MESPTSGVLAGLGRAVVRRRHQFGKAAFGLATMVLVIHQFDDWNLVVARNSITPDNRVMGEVDST